ncbi:hypothetical protein F4804DRAFT_136762 [Jackrogersella minutella]|nr:hypothetical protein F4804DRAFT_136762 [Jackrogersella minutella]
MSSTLLPFLYHTRTILRGNPRKSIAFARSLHTTTRRPRVRDDIPFDFQVGDQPLTSEPIQRGTITPSERLIFERIFADIKARGLKPTLSDENSRFKATRSTMLIMEQAAQDAGQSRPATIAAPGLLAGAARDRNKALLRFPPELRAAASKALNTIESSTTGYNMRGKDENNGEIAFDGTPVSASQNENYVDDGWKAPPHTYNRTIELEAKREPERSRVEGLITNAKTDFELWDVLEKEVFTMPTRLGINRSTPKDTEPSVPQTEEEDIAEETASSSEESGAVLDDTDAPKDVPEETENLATEDDTPPRELSLYVHGPLYPAYLLLALRRLDTAFHAPSPLSFLVLPRIKELGLESYILGVSTPFYNELLEIYWTRRGDLTGLLDLLEEMRHCGLYFDRQTAGLLNRVDAATALLATRSTSGSFGRAIMTMPEYEAVVRGRLRHWHRAVDLSVKEKEQDMGY